jgi:Asp-tRNA(Asn)/Glu-tRNA(Gln) amidotransferase A subunit family amidase
MVFPTGLKVELGDTDDQIAQNDDERHLYSTCEYGYKCWLTSDSPEVSIDAPIGLQLCRPRWQDEELFAVARKIDPLLPL